MSSNELGTFINVVENNLFINEDSRDTLILTYVDSDSDTIIFTDDNGKKVVFFTNEDKMRAEIEKLEMINTQVNTEANIDLLTR